MPYNLEREAATLEGRQHLVLVEKLTGLTEAQWFKNFKRCGLDRITRTCHDCKSVESFNYHCSLKWCPHCNWKITRQRRKLLTAFASQMHETRHVVLTMRNFPVLTRQKIRSFTRSLSRLRRQKVFAEVRGGTYSIEITNEGRGWHLHAHLLVEARWVDARELAVVWGRQIGQEFGIVKVKDCSEQNYIVEVTKYVCKPSQIVSWAGEEIHQFVRAVSGVRCFGVFGRLFKYRKQILALNPEPDRAEIRCNCGCGDFTFQEVFDTDAHRPTNSD